MTARWEEVLDAQLDLSLGLSDPHGDVRLAAEGFAHALADDGRFHGVYADSPGSLTRGLPDRLSAMTFNADPVYVDPDMQTVWEASIAGFQPEPLAETDLITPAGFLLLPRGHYGADRRNKQMSWRALLWHPQELTFRLSEAIEERVGPRSPLDDSGRTRVPVQKVDDKTFTSSGLLVSLWHDTRDNDDYTDHLIRGLGGRKLRGLLLTHVMPWHWGEDFGEMGEPANLMRPLQSLWRLMLQTVADRSEERATSPFRRRWEKAHWPEKHVTVVRLRRPRQEHERDGESTPVAWTHRWIVGGHWRWQWHPKADMGACGHRYEDGRICDKFGGVHKQIWVGAFQKGPDHLPLVVNKARVFELVR